MERERERERERAVIGYAWIGLPFYGNLLQTSQEIQQPNGQHFPPTHYDALQQFESKISRQEVTYIKVLDYPWWIKK